METQRCFGDASDDVLVRDEGKSRIWKTRVFNANKKRGATASSARSIIPVYTYSQVLQPFNVDVLRHDVFSLGLCRLTLAITWPQGFLGEE
jgi:hypothetical protein